MRAFSHKYKPQMAIKISMSNYKEREWMVNVMGEKYKNKNADNCIVMNTMPLFLEYAVGVGSLLKYFVIFVIGMFIIVIGMMAIYVLFGEGWLALWHFTVELFTVWQFMERQDMILIAVIVVPFLLWWWGSKCMIRYFRTNRFVAHQNGVRLEKQNGSIQELSYAMLGDCVRSKKIKIGPDWIKIPYEEGSIRLYFGNSKNVVKLLQKLGNKCNFPVPQDELQEAIRKYMLGWFVSYLFGVPCILLGCYVTMIGFMSEGTLSMNEMLGTLLSSKNVLGVAGVIIFLIGVLLKLVYYDAARKCFKPYREYFQVSL